MQCAVLKGVTVGAEYVVTTGKLIGKLIFKQPAWPHGTNVCVQLTLHA